MNPAQIVTVNSVQPLTSSEARTLPISISTLGTNAALARVDTSGGVYILSHKDAATLPGELVRVTAPTANPAFQQSSATSLAQASAAPTPPTYNAKLQSASAAARTVQVQFLKPNDGPPLQASTNTASQINTSTVSAVHTARAYLTPDGPKSDLRIETPLGDLNVTLPNGARPAVGDIVNILPAQADTAASQLVTPTAAAATAASATLAASVSTTSWPAFEQAVQSLAAVSTEGAQSLAARTAQGGLKLANSTLFLMTAMGSSSGAPASTWIGKAAEKALAGRNPLLLEKLKSDIGRIFNMAADTSGEWRGLLLPFDARSNDMPMLAFLYSHGSAIDPDKNKQSDENQPDEKDEQKRFVLEVQFSILGAIQLEGSIKGLRFDLMVRSQQQFPPQLTQDTRELFGKALAAGAFTGSLGFSVEEKFSIDVASILDTTATT
ncbi:MAG: hypothetical protein JKY57_05175 [Kordiimonadaceae bacterium]|nr:hypothetical protein [Kordiimonadaceae bacterium]